MTSRFSDFSLRLSYVGCMKRSSLLLLFPALMLNIACERHSASSLPAHGEHSAAPHAAAAAEHAPAKAPAASEKKAAEPAPAPKFF